MRDQAPGHGSFEELAAGYALDALDRADEQRFLRHARQCPACARILADYREVTAALAGTAPPAEPRPELADRIMVAVLADPGTGQPVRGHPVAEQGDGRGAPADMRPRGAVPLRFRARRWLRPALAAAAALIAAGGIWAGLAATSGSTPQPPLASCGHERGCSEVILTATAAAHAARRQAGEVIIASGEVWMVPVSMRADNTADQIYVLWQLTSGHAPRAVGSFDVRAGSHAPVEVGRLAAPYASTLAFAVSLEHGRSIPAAPSPAVALGRVS